MKRWCLVLALLLVCSTVVVRSFGGSASPAAARPGVLIADDAGDDLATTGFDGPMVRRRAAIALHPVAGADRAGIARELRAAARTAQVGPLTDATFAVFSAQMLDYLVPEMTMVLPEGTSVTDGEAFMRDHQPDDVAFYLVEPVLVHDLTFAVVPAGVSPADARTAQDREGVLADSLNSYDTQVQRSGLTVRYLGALLSDGQIQVVREAMGRAAHVPAERVAVAANLGGPGIDLANGVPDLADPEQHHN